MAEYKFDQMLRVRSGELDGDESGLEWIVEYVVYETVDDDGQAVFDLYDDDGRGNGKMLARFVNRRVAREVTLRLGEFVEWAPGIGRAKAA